MRLDAVNDVARADEDSARRTADEPVAADDHQVGAGGDAGGNRRYICVERRQVFHQRRGTEQFDKRQLAVARQADERFQLDRLRFADDLVVFGELRHNAAVLPPIAASKSAAEERFTLPTSRRATRGRRQQWKPSEPPARVRRPPPAR